MRAESRSDRSGCGAARWLTLALIATACSPAPAEPAPVVEEAACSSGGYPRFPIEYFEGPGLTRDDLGATNVGRSVEAFLVSGPGDPVVHGDTEAFSIVSDSLVLGYRDGLPTSSFKLDGDRVVAAGGCRPVLVSGDLVAYRWEPTTPLDTNATVLHIQAAGGACVRDGRTEDVTEIVSIDVTEDAETVAIVVWVRRTMFEGWCAGVGATMTGEAELLAPLGDRVVIDAGTVPATVHTD